MLRTHKIPKHFHNILKRIYGLPASVTTVTGEWKSGKTDFSLFLAECLTQLGLIDICASNIQVENTEDIEFIKSFTKLKAWLFSGKKSTRKLFIYDETTESAPKRRAMAKLNVEWVKTIPQFSKARGHLITVTQWEDLNDSIFIADIFNRGIWTKINRKTVKLNSKRIGESILFRGIPRTNFKFDPYLIATFQLSEVNLVYDVLPIEFKASLLYSEGKSFREIALALGLPQATSVRRLIQRSCKSLVTLLQQQAEGKKLVEIVTNG